MRGTVFALSLVVAVLGAVAAVVVVPDASPGDASAKGKYIVIAPHVARDGPPPAPATPPNFDTDRKVDIHFDIDAKELSATASGTTVVNIFGSVTADLPDSDHPVVTATGTFTMAKHPPDAGGCTYTRTVTKSALTVTFYYTQDLSVLVSIDAPEWFYTVQCPAPGAPPIRLPASGEEGMFHFIAEIVQPYREGGLIRFPMSVPSGIVSCVKRQNQLDEESTTFTAHVGIHIAVYQPDFPGGCLVPL